jgi:hypothetical protein
VKVASVQKVSKGGVQALKYNRVGIPVPKVVEFAPAQRDSADSAQVRRAAQIVRVLRVKITAPTQKVPGNVVPVPKAEAPGPKLSKAP